MDVRVIQRSSIEADMDMNSSTDPENSESPSASSFHWGSIGVDGRKFGENVERGVDGFVSGLWKAEFLAMGEELAMDGVGVRTTRLGGVPADY